MSDVKAGDIVVLNRIIFEECESTRTDSVKAEEGDFVLIRSVPRKRGGNFACSHIKGGESFSVWREEFGPLLRVDESEVNEKVLQVIAAIGGHPGKHFDKCNWTYMQVIAAAMTLARSQRGPIQ